MSRCTSNIRPTEPITAVRNWSPSRTAYRAVERSRSVSWVLTGTKMASVLHMPQRSMLCEGLKRGRDRSRLLCGQNTRQPGFQDRPTCRPRCIERRQLHSRWWGSIRRFLPRLGHWCSRARRPCSKRFCVARCTHLVLQMEPEKSSCSLLSTMGRKGHC